MVFHLLHYCLMFAFFVRENILLGQSRWLNSRDKTTSSKLGDSWCRDFCALIRYNNLFIDQQLEQIGWLEHPDPTSWMSQEDSK